ncbi:hypothetical protein H9P43_008467 [Blastocladiella emersonii ATCC 22665]|nr:hypothetical protein H9P43_008467 [Blastocladiella emersonii ATCC 22665]
MVAPLAFAATAALALLAAASPAEAAGSKKAKCRSKVPHMRDVPLPIPADEYLVKPANPADTDYVLRTGKNGEYMGRSRGAAQAKPVPMHPLPIPRKGYAPRTAVKAVYVADVPARDSVAGKPAVMLAKCDLKTKVPTIVLDNFPQITAVECASESVTLTFNSATTAAAASAEWAKAKGDKWAVLVGRQWKCNGKEEISVREVTAAAAAGETKVVLSAKAAANEDVIDTFALSVSQHDVPAASGDLAPRDIAKKQVSWDLNVNWDKQARKPVKPFIALLNSTVTELGADISVHGRATFSLEATGSITSLKTYRVALAGDLAGNLDLFLRTFKEHKADLFSVEVFVLPLTPFSIPGILSMSPEMRVKAAATYEMAASLKLSAGLEMSYPFEWSVESQNGLFAKPVAKAVGKMSLTPHPPTLSGEVSAGISAHIIPSFGVGLRIWKIPVFDLALELDSSVSLSFSANAKAVAPIQASVSGDIDVQVSHEHSLDFHVRSVAANKAFHIWGTGKLPLPALSFKAKGSTEKIGANSTTTATATATTAQTSLPTATVTISVSSASVSVSATPVATSSTSTATVLTLTRVDTTATPIADKSTVSASTTATPTATITSSSRDAKPTGTVRV